MQDALPLPHDGHGQGHALPGVNRGCVGSVGGCFQGVAAACIYMCGLQHHHGRNGHVLGSCAEPLLRPMPAKLLRMTRNALLPPFLTQHHARPHTFPFPHLQAANLLNALRQVREAWALGLLENPSPGVNPGLSPSASPKTTGPWTLGKRVASLSRYLLDSMRK